MKPFWLKYRWEILFSILVSSFFLVMMLVEKANGRFWLNDFKVFYMAAQALVENEQVYGVAFGLDTGYYKYSPFTLLLFTPYTLFSYSLASSIHFWIIVGSILGCIFLIQRLYKKFIFKNDSKVFMVYLLTFICVITHLIRELHLGNTNIILLLLLTLSLYFTLNKKDILTGLVLAVIVITKPYFIVLGLPYLLYKNWKIIASTTGALGLYFLVSFLLFGIKKGTQLYSDWIISMQGHSSMLESSHTINSLLNTYIGTEFPPSYNYLFFIVTCILLFTFFFRLKSKNEIHFILFFYLLIAFVPNLLITDTEHFLFSIPLIIFHITRLKNSNNYLEILFLSLVIILYLGNWSDLLGSEISDQVNKLGLLGISNLILIGLTLKYTINQEGKLIDAISSVNTKP